MQHVTLFLGGNINSKFQLHSSYGLGERWLKDEEKKYLSFLMNEKLINDKGVCRIAPATPLNSPCYFLKV